MVDIIYVFVPSTGLAPKQNLPNAAPHTPNAMYIELMQLLPEAKWLLHASPEGRKLGLVSPLGVAAASQLNFSAAPSFAHFIAHWIRNTPTSLLSLNTSRLTRCLTQSGLIVNRTALGKTLLYDRFRYYLDTSLPPPLSKSKSLLIFGRGRLVVPIRDSEGDTVGFGGRVVPAYSVRSRGLESKPLHPKKVAKYVNSPSSPGIYHIYWPKKAELELA